MRSIYDVEKLTDDVMMIANRVILRMNVSISYYTNDNKRLYYHREVEYYSNKANQNLINIKRHFDYYLSIEHIQTKDFIRIGPSEMFKLQDALEHSYEFFTNPKYKNLYAKKDNDLIMYNRVDPITIIGLPMDKYLQFEPCIFTNFRGEPERGLRMYLSSQTSYCDISIRSLEGFLYTIKNFNLFQAGQNMINYIPKPDLGTNLYTYNIEPEEEADINFHGKEGRTVTSNKNNMSYFDKMKNLE